MLLPRMRNRHFIRGLLGSLFVLDHSTSHSTDLTQSHASRSEDFVIYRKIHIMWELAELFCLSLHVLLKRFKSQDHNTLHNH